MTIPDRTIGLSKLGPGSDAIGLREHEVRPPGPGEVLIDVLAAGICGTDLHIVDDEFPSDPPVTMGHEVTGEVAGIGDGVDPSWLEARVAVETYFFYCAECEYCRNGRPNQCAERRSIGSHVDGGFARWLTVPERNLHRVPDHVGVFAGALAEPLACVANCMLDPSVVTGGNRVLIVGPGTMGILTAQVARASGGDVIVAGLERDRVRLDIAARLGLETIVLDRDSDIGQFDVVCECSGSAAGAATALDAVRKRGTYVQVGIFGAPIAFDLDRVLYDELTVRSGFASTPGSWDAAMGLLEQDHVQLDPLVSEVIPLNEWQRAFAATRAGEGMKFVLDPRSSG